jgi:hypothetical protein
MKNVSDAHAPAAGSHSAVAPWLQIDGAAAYMGNVSRKTVYAAVAAGMRAVRLGGIEPHRDSRGRLIQGRLLFRKEWIDAFLEARSTGTPLQQRGVDAKSLTQQHDAGRVNGEIATPLQRAAEIEPAACAGVR